MNRRIDFNRKTILLGIICYFMVILDVFGSSVESGYMSYGSDLNLSNMDGTEEELFDELSGSSSSVQERSNLEDEHTKSALNLELERSEVSRERTTTPEIGDITVEPIQKRIDTESTLEPKTEEKSVKIEFVITRSAELSIKNLFPPIDNAIEITIEDMSRYPSVEIRGENVLEDQLNKNINYYKVSLPSIHDSISGLGTSDPRVEIGVTAGFDLFVNEYQPRLERILNFLNANSGSLSEENMIKVAVSLFSIVTYGECLKIMRNYKDSLNDVDFCTMISREDVLSVQPEDLPKNLMKERDEIYPLRGIVLSIPFPLFTNMSILKWRHVSNPLGVYQAYNSGAIDGFAHFDFLSKKLRDMTTFLHTPKYQFWDDVRLEIYHAIRKLRSVLTSEGSSQTKKLLTKLALFYVNWFKGSKFKKPCSTEFNQIYLLLQPIYEGIREIRSVLNHIKNDFLGSSTFEEEFGKFFNKRMFSDIVSERRVLVNAISPMFFKIYSGLKEGKITYLKHEVLRIFAILEEIDFSTGAVIEAQESFKKCSKYRANQVFKSELRSVKRIFYKLIKVARKIDAEFPYPLPSSPLYIKGVKFGIKNLFRKNSARNKLNYYREYDPFGSSNKKKN